VRSRRTPTRPAQARGPNFPWVPLGIAAGVAVIVALIGYVIWQSGKPGEDANAEAVAAEADSRTTLAGEWIDLPEIYGVTYGDNARHVDRAVDYATDCNDDGTVCNSNPPAGGPHWGAGPCPRDPDDATPFCGPVPWGIYRETWPAESVVHNMEHGGIVVWYNTDNTQLRDELEDLINNNHIDRGQLVVMLPYEDMEEDTIALTAWSRIDKFPVSEYSEDRVETFFDDHARRFNPEKFPEMR
jgi:hypothetical protein